MWMRSFWTEDHQIRDVDDSDSEFGKFFAEESSCCYHFEGEFDANPDEDAGGVALARAESIKKGKDEHI